MMIATRNDPFFPVQSVEKLYARAAEPKEIIWTETQHVRSRKSDLVDEILTQIEWLTLPRTPSGPRSGSALPRPETGAM